MISYLYITAGILLSALAQVLLKRAAAFSVYSTGWIGFMLGGVIAYAVAFLLYAVILRRLPLSVVSPVMTVCVMILVVIAGLLLGEAVTLRKCIGVGLGIMSVITILGSN